METNELKTYIPVLSIAGSDPSGGAGIQQDIKTCEAFGCYGMAAITALTAQSPTRVSSTLNTSNFLEAQLTALLDEVHPSAVKVGMMPDAETVRIITENILRHRLRNIVVDPVIASSSGRLLTDEKAIVNMKLALFRRATIITPNIPEAEILLQNRIKNINDAKHAAKQLSIAFGCKAVLVKGGHSDYHSDILYLKDSDSHIIFHTDSVSTPNTHGTGCRLSSAIACCLAKGLDLPDAVGKAKQWLTEDLRGNALMRFPQPHQNL